MNEAMMNTQALDALAALCGAATSVPPAAAPPASSVANNNSNSSYALIARQLQENQAAAAAVVTHQAHHSAAARQATALSTVSPDVLQAYLIEQARRSPGVLPGAVTLDHGAGASFSPGFSDSQLAAFAGSLRSNPSPSQHRDLNANARAIAAKIIMTQQQQQQLQFHQPQQQQQPQRLPQPQQQFSFPSITTNNSLPAPAIATLPTPHSAHAPATMQHPQSAPSLLPYASPITPQHTFATQDVKFKPQSPPTVKRPPPKKRGLADPALKSVMSQWEDKKQAKRAANRLSAHLSRKRKKMLIDDLKGENTELRRKEQILQAIPDLVVVFDSSGCMPFVSRSVTRFLDHAPEDLENSSFWDLLTEDSVQSIKSAFMDALAVKRPAEQDSTPLCDGESMVVELVEGNGEGHSGLTVSLKGVVHFSGDSPECVCSIRPEGHGRRRGRVGHRSCSGKEENASSPSSLSEESVAGNNHAVATTRSHQISDVDSEKGLL